MADIEPIPELVTRQEAIERGLKRFHGKPCVKCGSCERQVCNSGCIACAKTNYSRWREINRERDLSNKLAYNAKNKKRLAELNAARYRNNTESQREYHKVWYQSNRGRRLEVSKNWAATNPEKQNAKNHRRRALLNGADGNYTPADLASIRQRQHDKCVYCNIPLCGGGTIDHIMPLKLGGSNWPENLQYTCAPCNKSKGAKHPDIFEASLKAATQDTVPE